MTNGVGKPPKHVQELNMFRKHSMVLCSEEEDEIHSPTDSSEDSVEVKVSPVSGRSKRKCTEPRKFRDDFTGPLKKRMCLQARALEETAPFRPWNVDGGKAHAPELKRTESNNIECESFPQPLPLVAKHNEEGLRVKSFADLQELRVPIHPQPDVCADAENDLLQSSVETFPKLTSKDKEEQQQQQRNYKNMTRERRIEANARERTRVHTISAAFETLRRSVPSYSHNQKLSKLSVLRIACAYIMSLSNLVGDDEDGAGTSTSTPTSTSTTPSLAECVDAVTRTIQKEGKLRKKKDDLD